MATTIGEIGLDLVVNHNQFKSQMAGITGLAKKAGLDATTFNKSKRTRPDGKKRWPSLDSLNKIIEVCNISFDEFFALAGNENEDKIVHSIPYVECSRLLEGEKTICIDFRKNKWQRIRFPDGHDNLYALDINTDQFAPFYRNGTLLILSQESEIRRGDRIAVFMSDNSIVIREFVHRTATTLELKDVLSADKTSVNVEDIRIVHRIVWASQ